MDKDKRVIQVLDKDTIDQIAAGEVVERPASIVKELIENAIDAAASAVTVEIREGGISFIRITDNGSGIPKDQVRLAFCRHATSKIRSAADLFDISSLGFRGEALSSIAAVAQVELITKISEDLTGIRYVIEGGEERSFEEIGAPNGTTFLIRNLFYNTPARAKFLKSALGESNAVSAYVEQMALSNPGISFKYMVNGQTKLHTSGSLNIKELVYHIYGREITKELIEIDSSSDLMEVHGFLGRPAISRGNRNFEHCYVNGRYVKSKLLSKAIEEGYQGFMMQHKYPFTLIYINMDKSKVDVNVHPAKMELRFSNQEEIFNQLVKMIAETLKGREGIPEVTPEKEERTKAEKQTAKHEVPEPFELRRRSLQYPHTGNQDHGVRGSVYASSAPQAPSKPHPQEITQDSRSYGKTDVKKAQEIKKISEEKQPYAIHENKSVYRPEQDSVVQDKNGQLEMFDNRLLSKEARSSHKIIGQIFDTYWLVQYNDSLYIIDQHAAHEKVLFERMMRDFKSKKITSQYLNPPVIVTLTNQEEELIQNHRDIFENFGFEIAPFGGRDYQISAVPDNLYGVASSEIFIEILDHLEDSGNKALEVFTEKLASMSCKAAVKGNHKLSLPEVDALIDELLTLDNPYHCPHGRPTIISMSRYELEKKFKRVV